MESVLDPQSRRQWIGILVVSTLAVFGLLGYIRYRPDDWIGPSCVIAACVGVIVLGIRELTGRGPAHRISRARQRFIKDMPNKLAWREGHPLYIGFSLLSGCGAIASVWITIIWYPWVSYLPLLFGAGALILVYTFYWQSFNVRAITVVGNSIALSGTPLPGFSSKPATSLSRPIQVVVRLDTDGEARTHDVFLVSSTANVRVDCFASPEEAQVFADTIREFLAAHGMVSSA